MAHTPGPWTFEKGASVTCVRGANGERVCDDENYYPQAVDEDDMRLIAAAPEMLAALEQIVRYADGSTDPAIVSVALAAIAKATGQQG